ncbi:MFS transporter [Herbidospora daliensis]|uniref:MFS transporter n=1 Tax=Herbidospora daliensis TaxID=295585 RepID=UPI000783D757|nr:MFS transporter [Herbidospora daliensis]
MTSIRLPLAVGFAGISAAMVAILVAAGVPTPLLPVYEASWHLAPWELTLAFGVYSLALLLTILVIGSLSDHVGRRPLMIAALAVELVAMLAFLSASSIRGLVAARIVQGIATGAASSSLSAAVVELAPARHKKLGALVTTVAPLAGLALGAIFAGLLAQFATEPVFAVWLVLVVVMAAGTIFTLFTPETSTPKPGAWRSLRPRVSVPPQVRRLFATTLPGTISAFMTMALFLGLVPIVLGGEFGVHRPIAGALAAFVAFTAGGVASVVTTRVAPRTLRLYGAALVALGAVLFVATVTSGALPLLWVAAVFGGAGVGTSFSGMTRGLVPEVRPHERAELFAAIYLVGYLALGVPAIVAGQLVAVVGVTSMATGYGTIVAIVAVAGTLVTAARPRRTRPTGGAVRAEPDLAYRAAGR